MASVRAVAVLLTCCVLIAPPVRGQGSDCSCDITNSRCDESGICRCDPGWDGDHCDRCVPMPGCRHGYCQQPWQCSCEPGWGGRFCDKDLSVCEEQQPCQQGAPCVMEASGEYTCLCREGFHGRNCQLKTGPCLQRRSPCKNGGLCEDADGFAAQLTCRCLAGFTGPRCETDVDDCLMRPCANGATCLDGINRFSCVCPPGFTGRFCTVNRDECAGRPCLHGGRCLDRPGGFHCVCRPGFTGAACQTELRARKDRWTTLGWEGGGGGGGGVRPHLTTSAQSQKSGSTGGSRNSSRHGDRLFKVTVSERSTAGLLEVQLLVLLVLAVVTLGVVTLTAALVLQGHCRDCSHAPCWPPSASQRSGRRAAQREPECQISFLNVAEPEKKRLNSELI